ncbi:DUF6531 domain-containing protein [Streptomyces sp. NPDC048188]|uniref:DUF6531 domain-containing protein n=1 Tax=Streptomyces sp. NPDC048188 TaxID=3155749 RepID=UPI00344090A4
MVGHRPSDWHVLDLDKDPTPGDPQRVRTLAKTLHDFADDVSEALRLVKGMAGESTLAEWAGKSAAVFKEEFSGVPKNLKKLEKSYGMCGDALADFWPKLERAQALADKALIKAREARADLTSAQSKLSSADSWVTRASKEADKYKDDPTGSKSDADKPDEAKVRAATRDAQHAKTAQTNAQSAVDSAQGALDAAKKMAEDARKMRDDAAREAKSKIDDASDAGIQNRSWWEDVGDWFSDNWDTIVAVCKVVVAVVGIIAMVIGGPILGALVLVAALVVLADTLYKYSKGQASLWDVGLAALDCIPGMKGLTTLGGLAKGLKAFGKVGLKGMAMGVKGLGKGARALGRPMKKLFTCGDPIDMATGHMVMSETDVSLPGVLPLILERHHRTGLETGRLFGRSWSSTLDQRLQLDLSGVRFFTADGMTLHYPVPERDMQLFPVEGPRWPIRWNGEPRGDVTIQQPETGQTLHFRPTPGHSEGELCLHLVSDRNGNTISIVYGIDGSPQEVVHHGGYRVGVTCEDGRISELALLNHPDRPSLLRYAYNGRGDLIEIRNSSGLPLKFTYDERHRITGWEDRIGTWYRYMYDDRDRCVAARGVDGILDYAYSYDDDALASAATNSLGYTSRFQFNDSFQLVTEIDPLGGATHRVWDRYDNLLTLVDPLERRTECVYDDAGRPVRIQLPDGSVTTTDYDDLGLPIATVEPDGATWRQRHDAHGNLVEAMDPTGAVTRYTYAAGGRLISHTDALGATRSLVTDAAGLPLQITDSLGDVTRCSRDPFGRVVELSGPAGVTARMGWTVEGLPAYREEADGSRESWEYDAEGNELLHQDPSGAIVRHEVGPFDLPHTRTDPDGAVYQFTYDTEQQLRSVTNPQGRVWTYGFDAVGRLTAERDFNGSDRVYQYDGAGQLTQRSAEAGESVSFTYDLLGHTVTQTCSDGSVTAYRHNAVGDLVWARNSDAEVEIERDALGRIVRESINGRVVSSVYDALGRRTERVTPSGVVSRWAYDSEDRPTGLKLQGHTIEFEHDRCGRDVRRRLGPATVLTQSWRPDGYLAGQEILTEAPEGLRQRWHRSFAYAPGGRLMTMEAPGGEARSFQFDAAGRVTSVAGGQWQERYDYDSVGNVVRAAAPIAEADGGAGTNGIGIDDRQTSGTLVREAGGYRYEHDKQGRVVRRFRKTLSGIRKVWRYVWSPEDRLTDLVTPEGDHWKYRYDPLGRRIAKQRVDDGGTVSDATLFDWDGENLAEEETAAGRVRTWEYEPDSHRPVLQTDRRADQQEYDRRFHAIVTDLVGTPTELLSEQGTVVWRPRTTLWGLTVGATRDGAVDCPLRFPGQYFDEESGWHYNFYRYYDPQTAQYATPDPLGLLPEDNPHSYVRNPLSWLDVLGLAPCAKVIALRLWKARNNQGGYSVYHGFDAQGKKIYAGITNNMARRERQHIAKNYGIVRLQEVRGATGLKKWQARAIEQGLIEDVRASGLSRMKNGVSISQINSISPKRLIYGTAVRYGRIFLA